MLSTRRTAADLFGSCLVDIFYQYSRGFSDDRWDAVTRRGNAATFLGGRHCIQSVSVGAFTRPLPWFMQVFNVSGVSLVSQRAIFGTP